MALIRVDKMQSAGFKKYALAGTNNNSGTGRMAYDNGSGIATAEINSTNTASDLFDIGYGTGWTVTFKANCHVVAYFGSTTFEGDKSIGDTMTASYSQTNMLFAYTN